MTARRGLPTPGSRERERESSRGRGAASQGQRQNQRETKEEREPLCYNLWFKERCAWLASSQCFRMKLSVYPIKKKQKNPTKSRTFHLASRTSRPGADTLVLCAVLGWKLPPPHAWNEFETRIRGNQLLPDFEANIFLSGFK